MTRKGLDPAVPDLRFVRSDGSSFPAAIAGARTPAWPLLAVLGYTACRIVLLAAIAPFPAGISHDSAYILTAARNVLAGRGLVSDAHWLVFLSPSQLPMAFHNSNPLYPLAIALVSAATGRSVETAGFLISALASGLSAAALVLLLAHFGIRDWRAAALTALCVLFPPVFASSTRVLPDALWLAFALWFVVFAIRATRPRDYAIAGAFLGLAWLTRSTAILLVPALAVLLIARLRAKPALRALALIGSTASLVASPWLLHTWRVWGNPLRSDAPYYLLQNYLAGGHGNSVERFWHSISLPPSLLDILRTDAVGLLLHWIDGLPCVWRALADGWGLGSPQLAVVLGIAALAVLAIRPHGFRSPYTLAAATYVATLVLVFAGRSQHLGLEIRLVILASTVLAAAIGWLALDGLRSTPRAHKRSFASLVLLAAAATWIVGYVPALSAAWKDGYGQNEELKRYFELSRAVADTLGHRSAVVVGSKPYFYTWATGVPSLSIPDAGEEHLEHYMERYRAQAILLTKRELEFWRPSWQDVNDLPAFLRLVARPGGAYLFELREARDLVRGPASTPNSR
ncbi:MAG TPA: glycosyltransferase family 39 protein [Gemmatimonadaceae bacterium]|nr:glycosyltransferase family 39 protein [Gemmatimonadaceae bacterium]